MRGNEMNSLCNVWGQGAIFAYSGIDGACHFSDDFAGSLCGDCLGIKFDVPGYPVLMVHTENVSDIEYQAVTSDYIDAILTLRGNQEKCRLIIEFSGHHLVLGRTSVDAPVFLSAEALISTYESENNQMLIGRNQSYTTLMRKKIHANEFQFALAWGQTKEDAIALAKRGLQASIDEDVLKKQVFYKNLPNIYAEERYQRLFCKCCSIMKSQIYTAEGMFCGYWSTPDRIPHHKLWLWDSVFHSLGHRHFSMEIAKSIFLAIFDTQQENGFIPHMATPTDISPITQPPILSWGLYKLYECGGNIDLIQTIYPKIKRYLSWMKQHRQNDRTGLFCWETSTKPNCRCDECGMDNSPRFDHSGKMNAIDLSCYMANEYRHMQQLAEIIDNKLDARQWQMEFDELKHHINQYLWDDEDQFYYDTDVETGEFVKVESVASFLPLYALVCEQKQTECLIEKLKNPDHFGTDFPIPSVAVKDSTFGSDMWRGAVWINFNYMIIEGLKNYGANALAEELLQKTIDNMCLWYEQDGVIYEFYDSNGKMSSRNLIRKARSIQPYDYHVHIQAIRDYGWSATLLADLLMQRYGKGY
jgi:glycogen debranching enzyme